MEELKTKTEKTKTELPFPTKEKVVFEVPEKYLSRFTDSPDQIDYAINTFKSHYERLSDIEDGERRFQMALMNMIRENRNKKDLDGNDMELSQRGLREVTVFLNTLKTPITTGQEISEESYEFALLRVKISQEVAQIYDPKKTLGENVEILEGKYAEILERLDREFLEEVAKSEKFYQEHLEIEKQQEMFDTHNKKAENEEITIEISDTIGTVTLNMREYEDFNIYDVFQAAEINNQPHLFAHALNHVLENAESFQLNGQEVTGEQRVEIIRHLNRNGPEGMIKMVNKIERNEE